MVCGIDLAGTANDIGDSRDVFYRARPPGSTAWGAWSPLGDNGFDGELVAAIARDGGLEVVTPTDVFPGPGQEFRVGHRKQFFAGLSTVPELTPLSSAKV